MSVAAVRAADEISKGQPCARVVGRVVADIAAFQNFLIIFLGHLSRFRGAHATRAARECARRIVTALADRFRLRLKRGAARSRAVENFLHRGLIGLRITILAQPDLLDLVSEPRVLFQLISQPLPVCRRRAINRASIARRAGVWMAGADTVRRSKAFNGAVRAERMGSDQTSLYCSLVMWAKAFDGAVRAEGMGSDHGRWRLRWRLLRWRRLCRRRPVITPRG